MSTAYIKIKGAPAHLRERLTQREYDSLVSYQKMWYNEESPTEKRRFNNTSNINRKNKDNHSGYSGYYDSSSSIPSGTDSRQDDTPSFDYGGGSGGGGGATGSYGSDSSSSGSSDSSSSSSGSGGGD